MTVGTLLAVLHCGIGLPAVLTVGDGLELFDFQLRILEVLALCSGPLPEFCQIAWDNAADLADLQRDGADLLEIVLNHQLLHRVNDVIDGAQLVHYFLKCKGSRRERFITTSYKGLFPERFLW